MFTADMSQMTISETLSPRSSMRCFVFATLTSGEKAPRPAPPTPRSSVPGTRTWLLLPNPPKCSFRLTVSQLDFANVLMQKMNCLPTSPFTTRRSGDRDEIEHPIVEVADVLPIGRPLQAYQTTLSQRVILRSVVKRLIF